MLNADTIQITPEFLALISEIDEFKGAWRAFGTLAPERLNALRHVATIESIGSSTRIEGSALGDREVARLLANLQIQSFASRDEQEVAGYAKVMETTFQSWADIPITENHIRQLHRDLLAWSWAISGWISPGSVAMCPAYSGLLGSLSGLARPRRLRLVFPVTMSCSTPTWARRRWIRRPSTGGGCISGASRSAGSV